MVLVDIWNTNIHILENSKLYNLKKPKKFDDEIYYISVNEKKEKEFLKLDTKVQKLVSTKILDLQSGNFSNDKQLKGKHKGKFRKRAGDYRIIYLKEDDYLVISLTRIAHRKEVY